MAGTYTPNRHLYKPAVNEVGWADAVNAGFDNLDNAASNGVNDVTIQDPSGNGMAVDSASNQTELISNDTLVINSAGHGSLTFGIGSDFSLQSRGAALIQASVGGASMTIGGNVSFTGTTVTGPTPSTGDNSTKFATTAFVKAQNYATASSLAAIASSGSWSDLQNATAPLVLNNGTNGTEIDQTSAATIAFKNTTAATSGASQSSPILDVSGTYWNGSASAEDKWTIQDVVGNGTNGTSTLTFSHSGSSGNSIVSLPKLLINNDFAVLPYLAIAGGYSGGNPTTASVYAQASSSSLRLASGATLLWAATSDARTGATDTGISRISAGVLALGNGTAGDTTGNLQLNQISKYNGEATAGIGASYLRGSTSQKSETGADANVLTVTPAAAAGMYRVSIVMCVSAASAATLGWTVTYTDANGVAQAPTNVALSKAGVAAPALTFSAAANDCYSGSLLINTNNAGTNIVMKTTFAGTSVAYKVSATIERLI